jgi:hypothetical protein
LEQKISGVYDINDTSSYDDVEVADLLITSTAALWTSLHATYRYISINLIALDNERLSD